MMKFGYFPGMLLYIALLLTGYGSRDTYKNTTAYLDRASAIARWICE